MATATAQPTDPVVQEKPSAVDNKVMLPTASPLPSVVIPERPALTAEQQKKYDWLLEKARSWQDIPAKDKAGPLTDSEKMWLSRECLLRFLRATKWHEHQSEKRLLETLKWRREYGIEELTWDYISHENETGKQIFSGYDKQGRPCLYLLPSRQNTEVSPKQNQHLFFMLERLIDIMPAGQETLALLINYKQDKGYKQTKFSNSPPLSQSREILHGLQTYYPERLGRALIINVPWVLTGFYKLIMPFIDPVTKEKLKFNEDMTQFVPKEQLWTEFPGGEAEIVYDHSVYWPGLQKLATERRAQQVQRWEGRGKQIGESEDYMKGKEE